MYTLFGGMFGLKHTRHWCVSLINKQMGSEQTRCYFFVFVSPQINELVDCRDVSIGAWFEACIEKVTLAPKGQIMPTKGKVGRPPKRTNGKLEAEQGQAHSQGQTTDSNRNNVVLNSESNGASTSQTDSTAATESKEREEDVIYHIKYEE